jgi:hypothetical protein
MRQPTFGISAVRVEDLDSVKEWFENSVKSEALAWLKDVKRRAPAVGEHEVWWWDRSTSPAA